MMSAEEKAAFLSARAGKLTASRLKDAINFLKNGQPSAARVQYMHDILAERMTGDSVRHFVTDAMQRGIDLEDEMFDVFVEQTGRDIRRSRIYDHPQIENFSASPDREIDRDGLLEGKVPQVSTFVRWRLQGGVPDEHITQLLGQCACSGKKWVGFVAYCPEMKEERHRLFMAKYTPEPEQIMNIEKAAQQFLNELEAMWEKLTTS